ncbi:unnamed protein product [Rhodiola kirilowii]
MQLVGCSGCSPDRFGLFFFRFHFHCKENAIAIWVLGRSSERTRQLPISNWRTGEKQRASDLGTGEKQRASGLSVWKARNNTGGNGSNSNTEIHSAKSVADSGNARSSRAPKRMTDPRQIYTCLSTSFRSFKFDIPPILVGESIRLWTCVICNSRMVLKS